MFGAAVDPQDKRCLRTEQLGVNSNDVLGVTRATFRDRIYHRVRLVSREAIAPAFPDSVVGRHASRMFDR